MLSTTINPNILQSIELELFRKAFETIKYCKGSDHKEDLRYTTYTTLASVVRSVKLVLLIKENYFDDNH